MLRKATREYFIVLLSVWIISKYVPVVTADHWGYLPEEANGVVKGEEQWGGQCSIGRRQSPIDLAKEASVMGHYSPLTLENYDSPVKNALVRNTGHSLQIDVPSDQEYLLAGGGLPGTFKMDQMHFHWSSEHTIDNKRFGLELHIVSHNVLYANFSEAVQNKRGVSVLGVLFHVADTLNPMLKNILDAAESIKDAVGSSNDIQLPLAPLDLLPKNRSAYFRYEGSLTTPSCDEAVIWTVLENTIPFAMTQIERFKQVKDAEGALLTHNFRLRQRLNARPLVYVHDDFERGYHSASPQLTFSFSIVGVVALLQMI